MKQPAAISWPVLILTLLLGQACQSTKSEEKANSAAETPVAATSPALAQAEELARRFGPIIKGAWVRADYLAAVQRTQSPLQAAGAVGEISEIHLNPAARTADSLVARVGFSNHEGGSLTVYLRPGQQPTALPTNFRDFERPGSFAELSYRLTARDTALLLTTYDQARKALVPAAYQRVRGLQPNELDALHHAVRQMLFAGRYTGSDSLGRAVRMEFLADGRVKGLKGFRSYAVTTDFAGGAGLDIDHLVLDPAAGHSRPMGYRHRGDSLYLYAARLLSGPDNLPQLVRGRRLFRLLRR